MRTFSIDEADRMVPFLQRTFEGIRSRSHEIARLNRLLRRMGDVSAPFEAIPEDLPEAHRRLRAERDREVQTILEAYETLGATGVRIIRGDGKVDFPAMLGENRVLLCWQFGESSVTHWHAPGSGQTARRPIARPEAFAPHYVN